MPLERGVFLYLCLFRKLLITNDLRRAARPNPLIIKDLRQNAKRINFFLDIVVFIWHSITMKHSESGIRKVLKQLRKCPDIRDIRETGAGHMIMAQNGEQYLAHLSAKAFHPLRRWLKKNTRLQTLKF